MIDGSRDLCRRDGRGRRDSISTHLFKKPAFHSTRHVKKKESKSRVVGYTEMFSNANTAHGMMPVLLQCSCFLLAICCW